MIILDVMSSCYSRILISESYDNIDREIALCVLEVTVRCSEGHAAISGHTDAVILHKLCCVDFLSRRSLSKPFMCLD